MNQENSEMYDDQDQEKGILGKDPSKLILCYFTCPQDAANAFLGALMLTDYRARPAHFSFVSPIRPTKVQRILYGSTLDEHVKIDVIGQKLLKDIPIVPDVIFVDKQDLLTIRRIAKMPTAFLSRNKDSESDPGRLTTLAYDTGSNIDDREPVGRILAYLETYVDLVEPFNRMREALKETVKSADS
ncbi:MAG: hypothetical protein JXM79_24470 [Sedimentisphaerales bacterium]|nr:hypothetical protein [Sedimentisphaerales bacterium]